MSKELIEKLQAAAVEFGSGSLGELMRQTADALKAKAAPVGEREAFEAALAAGALPDSFFHERQPGMWVAFQLGAAYQRAQQPQSAEAVAWAAQNVSSGKYGYIWHEESDVRGWINLQHQSDNSTWRGPIALYTTPQPSAGVVPEIPWQWSKSLTHCWPDDKDDRDGDWCVGCIDEEGNFYEVVKVEASQYDAAGESQKIAEAIVALWEFARLNGKEVGRG